MTNNIQEFALNLIKNNPNISNNPNAQEFINVIQSGDAVRGQQLANNLCKTYGITPDQALYQAKQFFNF